MAFGSFEDFKKSQLGSFAKYVDAKDSEFKDYLNKEFQEYKEFQGIPLYKKEKPKNIITKTPKKIQSLGPKVNISVDVPKEKKSSLDILQHQNKDLVFNFFGSNIGFNYDKNIKNAKFYPQNQKGIQNFFEILASSDYGDLIGDIKKVQRDLNLNDWGVYLLVHKISSSIFTNKDDQEIFNWFVFNKLGYDVRIGLASKHIIVMYYSKKVIYATPNYILNKKKFYVISHYTKDNIGNVYSYAQNYPGATKPLDLALKTLPAFRQDMRQKVLKFQEFGVTYKINLKYNQNMIDFMATYPQADYETYFNAPLDDITYISVITQLRKYINGQRASRAINFVLHFVQKSFKYEVDQEQFKREKVMFAYETLYYTHSDCEDRAVLFAYLMREMFHISVVGVKYDDHMATALYIPIKGDSVFLHHKRFVIADPTYINANIGESMQKYRTKIPTDFIRLY
ncbi:hypothetical protein MNB_SM-3-920 [hydrothermal vent metagenome]|uniref:Transglutaminase-like domain-containing protein n=1 Tax=hydrothermal vent metagenome TaxID=652676 RepID=A0A1W1D5S0_9ZZZZ